MTQNDLYIALAYGYVNSNKELVFDAPADIFDNIHTSHSEQDDTDWVQFSSNEYNIYQFGILTVPGVKIKLNENYSEVRVGLTGIWEINLSSLTPICSTVKIMNLKNNLSAVDTQSLNYCLIDVVYSKNLTGGVSD